MDHGFLKIGIRPDCRLSVKRHTWMNGWLIASQVHSSWWVGLWVINHFCKKKLISHSIFILSLPLSSFCRFSRKKYIPMCFCGINQGASKRGLLRGLRVIRWPYFYFSDAVSDEGLLCLEKKATEHTSSQDQQQRQKNPINNSSRRMIFNFPPFEKRLIWHAEDEREINWH